MGLKRKLIGGLGIVLAPATGGLSLIATGAAAVNGAAADAAAKAVAGTGREKPVTVRNQSFEISTRLVTDRTPLDSQRKAAKLIGDMAKHGWETTSQSATTGTDGSLPIRPRYWLRSAVKSENDQVSIIATVYGRSWQYQSRTHCGHSEAYDGRQRHAAQLALRLKPEPTGCPTVRVCAEG